MWRKRKNPTPHFGLPPPYNPMMGEYAKLTTPGIYPYCALVEVAAADTHDDYLICRGYDTRDRKFYDYDADEGKTGIAVAKPFGKRTTGLYLVGEVYTAFLPQSLIGQNAGTVNGTDLLDLEILKTDDDKYINWMLMADPLTSAWSGYLAAATMGIAGGVDSPISWTENQTDGSGISHNGTDITLNKAGWYHVDLTIQATPDAGARIVVTPRLRLNDTGGPPRDGAIWTAEVDETITSGPKSECWCYKFRAAAGDVLTTTVEADAAIAITLQGGIDASELRCHLSIAEIH